MTTKKKGNLTTSPEWAKHLRPIMKRWFWKGERNAELSHLSREIEGIYIQSVEELTSEINAWNSDKEEQTLFVAQPMLLEGNVISPSVGMSIVVDKILAKGFFPNGNKETKHGIIYFYKRG